MKPIEFEILMRDKTKAGIQSAQANVDLLTKQIIEQKQLISTLEQQLRQLEATAQKGASAGMDQSANIEQIDALKKEILSLNVAIEGLQAQKKKATDAIPEIARKDELGELLRIQKNYISDLEKQYVAAKAAFDKVNVSGYGNLDERKKASELFLQIRADLNAEKKALIDLEKQYQNVDKSAGNYTTQMRRMEEEMAKLRLSGQQESARYKELEQELARVGVAYQTVQKERKLLTTGGSDLAGIVSGVSALSGAFSAAQGVASLFVDSNEKLAAIQTKLQAAMAITIGLQQVSTALHSTSAFRITTMGKLTELWTSAQRALNTQLGISATLSKALMLSGIGLLIGGVTMLVHRLGEWRRQQQELGLFNLEVNNSIQDQVTKIQSLDRIVKDSNNSLSERKRAIDDLKKIMPEYNAQINEEGQLINKTSTALDNYIKKLKDSTKAKIAADKAVKAENALNEWFENLSDRDKNTIVMGDNSMLSPNESFAYEVLNKQRDSYLKEIEKWNKQLDKATKSSFTTVEENTKAYWELQRDNASKRLGLLKDTQKGTDEWIKAQKDYETAVEKLKLWDLSGKQTKSAETAEEKARKAAEQAKIFARELSREEQDLQYQAAQLEIDAMQEGAAKKMAQLKLNHEKEKEELKRQKEDYLQNIIKNEKEKFEADPKNKGKKFDESGVTLTDGQLAGFSAIDKMLAKKQNAELAKAYEDSLSAYQTYSEKRLKQIEEHIRKRNELELAGASSEHLSEMDRQHKEALSGIDKEFALKEETFKSWMDSITNLSLSQLVNTLEQVKRELSSTQITFEGENDPTRNTQRVAVLRAQIKALQEQLASAQGKDGKDTKRSIREWSELENVLSRVDRTLEEIGDSIGGTAGELISFAGQISTTTLSMISGVAQFSELSMKTVEAGASTAAKAISSVEKASVILAVVTSAMEIMEKIKGIFSTSAADQWELEFQQARLEMQLRYNEALVEQIALQNEMFGGDKYSNAMAYAEAYYQALINYEEQYLDAVFIRQRKKHSGGWFGKYVNPFYGAAVKGLSGSETYEVNARENMQIQTRHKTWFRSAKYQNLEEWLKENGYDNLFGEDGSLNLELAKSVLEMKGLTDETKNYLETLIAAQEQVDEMNESLRDYLNDTFGELGDSMTNAIVDAFKNGSDAAKDFKTDMISVLEEVGAQIVRSLFLQDYIDSYSKRLEDIYKKRRSGSKEENATAISREVIEATSDFFKDLPKAQKEANKWLEEYSKQAAANGFDVYTPDSKQQSGIGGAFTTMTQDQGTKLEGLFTSVQMHVAQMDTSLVDISEVLGEIYTALGDIAGNTARIEDVLLFLEKFDRDGIKMN